MKADIYQDSPEADAKLSALGLTTEILREAIMFGQLHWSSCTRNDPPSVQGLLAWGKTMRRLRELLIPHGWSSVNESGLPLVLNPAGSIAISVTAGDEGTGDPNRDSRTRYAKGPVTVAFIEQNSAQLSLFNVEEFSKPLMKQTGDCITWVLLTYRTKNEVRCELSLPSSIDFDGRGSQCVERIILDPVPLDSDEIDFSKEDVGEEFTVEISRRG